MTKQVTVQSTGYTSLKTNPGGRMIPWINLRGFWLEQVGFESGTQYIIKVYDGRLVLKIVDG